MTDGKSLWQLRVHFIQRLYERYGIALTCAQYDALNMRVREGLGSLIKRESNTRTHWLIDIDGLWVYVVYNKKVGGLVTALPGHAITPKMRADKIAEAKRKVAHGMDGERLLVADEVIRSVSRHYGINIDYKDYADLSVGMHALNGRYLGKVTGTVQCWIIPIKGVDVCVHYVLQRNQVIKAIPMDAIELKSGPALHENGEIAF